MMCLFLQRLTLHCKKVALATLFLFTTLSTAYAYSGMLFFGDSLTDNANSPNAPYSNAGVLWPNVIGHYYGLPVAASGLDGELGGNNWAVGGASTGHGDYNTLAQVKRYLELNPTIDSDQLVFVWTGSNDFISRILDKWPHPDPTEVVVDEALTNLMEIYSLLYDAGARNIISMSLVSLDETPAARLLSLIYGPAIIETVGQGIDNFNMRHQKAIASNSFPIQLIAVNTELDKVIKDPLAYGLNNVTDDWLSCDFDDDVCDPDDYLFWDLVHPTNAAHKVFASFMIDFLERSSIAAAF